jgi:hypothetical protein
LFWQKKDQKRNKLELKTCTLFLSFSKPCCWKSFIFLHSGGSVSLTKRLKTKEIKIL